MSNANQNRQYVGVDIFKLICAFLVVGIHWWPLREYGILPNYWFSSVVCRIAVPFFLISAGFFMKDKYTDPIAIRKYILRLLQLYVIYSLIYSPLILQEIWEESQSFKYVLVELVIRFIWNGTFLQFWFFPALIWGVVIIIIFERQKYVPDWCIGIVAVALYVIGVLASPNYYESGHEWIKKMVDLLGLYSNSRNAIFCGFPLAYLGHMIYKYGEKILKMPRSLTIIFCIVGMGLYYGEAYIANKCWDCAFGSMWFFSPVVACGIFLLLIQSNFGIKGQKLGSVCRKLSMWIFAMHMYIYEEFSFLVSRWGGQYLKQCIVLAALVTAVGLGIIMLTKTKTFQWMNNLF